MKHRIYISFGKESSGDDDGVGTTEGDGQHARKISLRWVGSIWFFSGAFSSGLAGARPLSGVGVQDLSQSVWVSQFEKGSCFLFSFSSFTQQKKYKQKCTSKPSNEVPGAYTCWFPIEPGLLGRPHLLFPYSSCCCVRTNHSTHEHNHCHLLAFPPSGGDHLVMWGCKGQFAY